MLFIVHRTELWIQEVAVEADSPEEAAILASEGEGTIHDDPRYSETLFPASSWKVEERSNNRL